MVKLRINDLLMEKGRTAYWLAIETGINHAVIAKLRHDRAKSIRFDVLESLCRVLECEPTDLFDIQGDMPENKRKVRAGR
jgi:putative transcriptional regulator